MNNTLNSIFVRLDVNMRNLTSKAIAQIIVKILYANGGRMTKKQIIEALAQVNDCAQLAEKDVEELLTKLSVNEIQHRKGQYYLSSSKREKIKNTITKSEERNNTILDRFFSRLNSSREVVANWLVDATIRFFEVYSEEWISDLKAKTHQIAASEDSIRNLITNRTNKNSSLDPDDKKELPFRFFKFVNTSDPLVDDYLWEYGTSAFASKLIRRMHGVDELTLETFRNSHCIIDTNILMFKALESRYKNAFFAIEKVFLDLGVKCSILYITKTEYETTIGQQKLETIHNLEKFGYDITSLSNDDFTNYAKSLGCKTVDDFTNFFDNTLRLPERVYNKLKIGLLDNDHGLLDAIEKAQKNEELKSKLNELFKAVVKHDKPKGALKHDIGLLEGVRFLRNNEFTQKEKYFILSEEISINQYSKNVGFYNGLPLSMRIETLINLLAVNNGGDTFNASDYSPLFANIIRMGLTPQKDTFRQSELYQYYKLNSRIADLPKNTTEDIVLQMHKKLMDGLKEDELIRDLNELVTDGEIKAQKTLEETQVELHHTNEERKREKAQSKIIKKLYREEVKKRITSEYDNETKRLKRLYKRNVPVTVFVVLIILCVSSLSSSDIPLWTTILLSLSVGVVSSVITSLYFDKKMIKDRIRNRDSNIEGLVNESIQSVSSN